MAERNHNKINYETNVVNPATFAILLNAVKENQPLSYEKGRDTVFPQARNNAGMAWKLESKDTHAANILEQYCLVKLNKKGALTVSDLGKEFLKCFDKNFKVIVQEQDYKMVLLKMLISWHIQKNKKDIHPGKILIQLLLDSRLNLYTTSDEFSLWTSNEEIQTDFDYEKIVKLILDYREKNYKVDIKKSDVFIRAFDNSWGIFNAKKVKSNYILTIKPEIKALVQKFFRNNSRENIIVKKLPIRLPKNNNIPLNRILYGAPGTGKTYSSIEYALALVENREIDLSEKSFEERKSIMERYNHFIQNGQIVFTTFHQSYCYEDFIQGLRPLTTRHVTCFRNVDGVFKTISDRAMGDSEKNYVIIIDEINRANISKVFGELITLIEEDKRWGEINGICLKLPSGDLFAVPNNLYIVGTMNSADESISLIDTALRRRFKFEELYPEPSLIQDEKLSLFLEKLNEILVEELDSIDLLIGHSYFINKKVEDLCEILNESIIPLLYEYFYNNRIKIEKILKDTIDKVEGLKISINSDCKFQRLCCVNI